MNGPALKHPSFPFGERVRSFYHLLLLVGVFVCLGSRARADFTLTLDLKEGDTISDVTKVVAHVVSDALILKVDFKVDDTDPVTATSTPYIYNWDTIADTEGAHKLTVTATDANGKTKAVTLSVTIDNEIATGAPALTEKAQAAVTAGDFATAFKYARRALKADPTAVDAVRALARGYVAQKKYDEAIAALEGIKNLDASARALSDDAEYRLQRGLLAKNIGAIVLELPTIADLRRKAADLGVKQAAGQPSAIQGDALLQAARYEDAQKEYGNTVDFATVNRQALANILAGRPRDGAALLRVRIKDHKSSVADRAVFGLAMLLEHDPTSARAIVAEDLHSRVPASLIVAAYADAALGKREAAAAEALKASVLAPNAPETYYALSMTTTEENAVERDLVTTIGEAPLQAGPYLDLAVLKILSKATDRNAQAFKLIGFAQKLEPDNINAKLIEALTYVQSKQTVPAIALLRPLARDYPSAPDVLMATAICYLAMGQDDVAGRFLDMANKIDQDRVGRLLPEQPLVFLRRVNHEVHYRTGFFLTPQTLTVPKTETASNP